MPSPWAILHWVRASLERTQQYVRAREGRGMTQEAAQLVVTLHRAAGIPAVLLGHPGILRIGGQLVSMVRARTNEPFFGTLEGWATASDIVFVPSERADPLVVMPWTTYLLLVSRALTSNRPTETAGKRCKALSASICERAGCTSLIPAGRRRGSPRRFCTSRCRWLAWRDAANRGRP